MTYLGYYKKTHHLPRRGEHTESNTGDTYSKDKETEKLDAAEEEVDSLEDVVDAEEEEQEFADDEEYSLEDDFDRTGHFVLSDDLGELEWQAAEPAPVEQDFSIIWEMPTDNYDEGVLDGDVSDIEEPLALQAPNEPTETEDEDDLEDDLEDDEEDIEIEPESNESDSEEPDTDEDKDKDDEEDDEEEEAHPEYIPVDILPSEKRALQHELMRRMRGGVAVTIQRRISQGAERE